MKQQIIELKKKLLLVELPEGIVAPEKSDNICIIQDIICFRTSNMKPTLRSFGKLTDITESQFTKLVSGVIEYGKQENHPIWTAKKGFFSKLTEDKIYFKNPLGEFPTQQNTGLEYGMEYISKVQNWEEAESKLWGINRCWIFEIL